MTRWRGLTHNQRAAIMDIAMWPSRDMWEFYTDSTLLSLSRRGLAVLDPDKRLCELTRAGKDYELQMRLQARV